MRLDPATAVFKVSADAVLAVLAFLPARADIRYYMNFVCAEPMKAGGARVWATDGQAIVVRHDPDAFCATRRLLSCGRSQRALLKKGGHVLAREDGTEWLTDDKAKSLWIAPAEAPSPQSSINLEELIGDVSEYQPGLANTFNPALLGRIAGAEAPKARYSAGAQFFTHPGNGKGLFLLGERTFGLVMPMRGHALSDTPLAERLPSDFLTVSKPEAANDDAPADAARQAARA